MKQIYEFGSFRLDPTKRILQKEGEVVSLTPKAIETLLALVEANGQLLEKDVLIQRLWPDSFVEEGNLTVYISTLRKALGENRGYILTEPGRGYRFVADVREVWDDHQELILEERARAHLIIEEEATPAEDGRLKRTGAGRLVRHGIQFLTQTRRQVALAVFLIGLVIIGVVWALDRRLQRAPEADWRSKIRTVQVASLKNEKGAQMGSGRLSPDGTLIAFSQLRDGYYNLWVKQISGGEPLQITKDSSNNISPIWSPDGRQLAFISDRGEQIGVWSVPFLGGTPSLLKTLIPDRLVAGLSSPILTDWSGNGATIYYQHQNNFFALTLASGEILQLTNFDRSHLALYFRISPDEEQIAYIDRVDGQVDLWIRERRSGALTRLTDDAAEDIFPLWHPDSKRLIYTSIINGVPQICVAYLDGRKPEQITVGEGAGYVADFSLKTARILYYSEESEADIWQVDLNTLEETAVTAEVGVEIWPSVSSDRIAFQSALRLHTNANILRSAIWVKSRASAGQPIQIADNGFAARWSPDGKQLAFLRLSGSRLDIWTVKAAGMEEKQLTTAGVTSGGHVIDPFLLYQPADFSWSPDSSSIAYCSTKDGASNVWVISADGTKDVKVSDNADADMDYYCPLWSPDGKHIAYLAKSGQKSHQKKPTWSVIVTDLSHPETVFETGMHTRLLGWSAADGRLIVGTVEYGKNLALKPSAVNFAEISWAPPGLRPIATVPAAFLVNSHLSPDGRSIAVVAQPDGRDNLYLLAVGSGELKRITNNSDPRLYFSSLAWAPDGRAICFGKQENSSVLKLIENYK
jgi:Tol biopolymer transport system component/DNA-binding winged helix-turn-helix (wHTH) protein